MVQHIPGPWALALRPTHFEPDGLSRWRLRRRCVQIHDAVHLAMLISNYGLKAKREVTLFPGRGPGDLARAEPQYLHVVEVEFVDLLLACQAAGPHEGHKPLRVLLRHHRRLPYHRLRPIPRVFIGADDLCSAMTRVGGLPARRDDTGESLHWLFHWGERPGDRCPQHQPEDRRIPEHIPSPRYSRPSRSSSRGEVNPGYTALAHGCAV